MAPSTRPGPVRLLIADDHPLMREGIVNSCKYHASVEVVAQATNGHEAIQVAAATSPDVVVMDLEMPGTDGFEAITRIKADHPDIRILVLSAHQNEASVYGAMAEGADGYLLKAGNSEEFFVAVERVARGQSYISPELSSVLYEMTQHSSQEPLDTVDLEILRMLAVGEKDELIAKTVHRALRTVRWRKVKIREHLRASNIRHAVSIALQRGLIRVPDDHPG